MNPQTLGLLYGALGSLVLAADLGVAVAALVVALRLDPDGTHRRAAWLLAAGAAGSFLAALLSRLSTLLYGPLGAALGPGAQLWVTAALDLLGMTAFAVVGVGLLRFRPVGQGGAR